MIEIFKRTIREELIKTQRPNVKSLISAMEEEGFYSAPCSGAHHLSCEGGLAEHSLNVLAHARALNEALNAEIPDDSIVITALLHDLGKMGQFGKSNYVPNMLSGRKTKTCPNPEPYQSTLKPFVTNPDLLYVDHEVRSVIIASQYIELTEEEQQAIL